MLSWHKNTSGFFVLVKVPQLGRCAVRQPTEAEGTARGQRVGDRVQDPSSSMIREGSRE